MSRSYKHFAFCKDVNSSKWGKRCCNKKIRKTKDVPNGKAYKKLVEPWCYIYDYSHHETWKDFQKHYNYDVDYFTYYKCYKMK